MTLLLLLSAQLLSGTVINAEAREPLALTIVTLHPNAGKQFTDAAGAFSFSDLAPGTYLLSVRQIGYVPLDTQVVLRAEAPARLLIVLRHVAVELPAITVFGHGRCTTPGPPNRDVTPALAAVFDQLIENARRLELLADSYPFRYRLERSQAEVTRRGDTLRTQVDTIEFDQNETRRRYRPGFIVAPGTGPFSGYTVVTLASLHELGDDAFHRTHCFRLAGRDTIEGETLVRIDFEPADQLHSSDIAGSAYLDSVTYGLRFTETSLTRPERSELRDVRSVVARTRFRDIAPGIALQEHVRAIWRYRSATRPTRVEMQRLLTVQFRRPLPQ
ncbi:MAG TPA: carboxypeptidase regulatory-like domain-containing protein [Gemmatimonadales bacterium]|nr:carboxypeptidase regulatory-like domain-containing protein [Gemmatimonadales bacterium]